LRHSSQIPLLKEFCRFPPKDLYTRYRKKWQEVNKKVCKWQKTTIKIGFKTVQTYNTNTICHAELVSVASATRLRRASKKINKLRDPESTHETSSGQGSG
jgi:hypothetical protein